MNKTKKPPTSMAIPNKKKPTVYDAIVSKYKEGDRVYGIRLPNAFIGTVVRTYCTVNSNRSGKYRNPAYVIKCDVDGKERSFQLLRPVSKSDGLDQLYSIH